MFETDRVAWLFQLFWLEVLLFTLAVLGGAVIPSIKSSRYSEDALKTWGMRIALTLALLGGLVATIAASWYLVFPCPLPLNSRCGFHTLIWPNLNVADLQLGFDLSLTLYMDPLAALFVLLVGFFTICVAIYSFGWLSEDPQRNNVASSFNLFAAALLFLLVVNNAFWLLLALELITLASAILMLYKGNNGASQKESRIALQTYLITSHISTMCLGVFFIILGVHYQSLDLQVFREPSSLSSSPFISASAMHIAFLSAFCGLGIRAGITPFHFWVPIAHPQLPTNTHAMMSSVMIKIAIYLMIRFFFEFLKPTTWWWGVLLLLLAGLTALINVFYALLSRDLKRALAYHSVENMGIILSGIGLALLFISLPLANTQIMRALAGLALVAALLHTFNHAIFKTLLFLATGSIEKITGTVVMDELGGLLKQYRWTSTTFLIGAIAITGFPPFNGFISEWLTIQSFLAGTDVYAATNLAPVLIIVLPLTLILLALSFAITALAFVKIAGESLLGFPRSQELAEKRSCNDVHWSMRAVLVLLATLCLVLGLAPGLLLPWLNTAVTNIGYDPGSVLQVTFLSLDIRAPRLDSPSIYIATLPIAPLITLVILPFLVVGLMIFLRRLRRSRNSPVWAGGEKYQPQLMQYTGSAISAPVWWELQTKSAKPDEPLPTMFVLSKGRYVVEGFNLFYNYLLNILLDSSQWFGERVQNGDIRRYLLYIFAAFVVILILLVTI